MHTQHPWMTARITTGKYAGHLGVYFEKDPQAPAFALVLKGRKDLQAIHARMIQAAPKMLGILEMIYEVTAEYDPEDQPNWMLDVAELLDEIKKEG